MKLNYFVHKINNKMDLFTHMLKTIASRGDVKIVLWSNGGGSIMFSFNNNTIAAVEEDGKWTWTCERKTFSPWTTIDEFDKVFQELMNWYELDRTPYMVFLASNPTQTDEENDARWSVMSEEGRQKYVELAEIFSQNK
jgi:hypothetical protein